MGWGLVRAGRFSGLTKAREALGGSGEAAGGGTEGGGVANEDVAG